MDTGIATYLVAGVGLFVAALLPLTRNRVVSTAMGFVAVGVVAGLLPVPLPELLPGENNLELIRRLTEVAVIVALMGAGLALDRRPGWRSWISTWRLLAIAMPLCIAAVALLGWGLMGLAPAGALLLGAVLAPTDPVLAADVKVGGPNSDDEDVVRHALTTEAGLNDGLAFPFVYAAIFLTGTGVAGADPATWALRWVAWELVGKVAIGVAVGVLVGWAFAWLAFRTPARWQLLENNEGILALAVTFASYGAAEAAQGWGFIAVFVTGLTIRGHETGDTYHRQLHDFTHHVERLLTLAALLMFGVALGSGLLDHLTWQGAMVALLLVLVVRPLFATVALARCPGTRTERLAKAFFGVRGIGSFFYLAYAVGHAPFPEQDLLWATVSATVLLSIVVHGVTAAPAMRRLDAVRT